MELAEAFAPSAVPPIDPKHDMSDIQLRAAVAALESGDADGAVLFAHRITSPFVAATLRADRRFDAIVARDPDAFDVARLIAAQLARARQAVASRPHVMRAHADLVIALHVAERFSESLQEADRILAGKQASPGSLQDDWGGCAAVCAFSWRSSALMALGRDQEAMSMWATDGRSAGNIGVAEMLMYEALPAQSLALIEQASDEGRDRRERADLARLRACDYAELHLDAKAARQVSVMEAHAEYPPDAVLQAQVCTGDQDAAARLLIAMLEDPVRRSMGLAEAQIYRVAHVPPFAQELRRRYSQLLARPDVKAALDKVGRSNAYDMPRYTSIR